MCGRHSFNECRKLRLPLGIDATKGLSPENCGSPGVRVLLPFPNHAPNAFSQGVILSMDRVSSLAA